ncbi:MAG: hypothetical protein NZ744_01965 [Pirellulaceae bacterium]|nr:hypothetical protein [Pirellulaceae bacterium]
MGFRGFYSGRAISVVLVSIVVVVSLVGLWGIAQSRLRHDDKFELRTENIQLFPDQPSWIREKVLPSVVKQHNLEELFLDDSNLTKQLADAFMLHSWILSVESVQKSPVGVKVHVTYRKPVAMVEVKYNDQPHVLPIDAGGTVLPPGDFHADDIANYLRIASDHLRPSGNVGDPWGDAKVVGAAKLAGLFDSIAWKEMGLYRIEVTMNPSDSAVVYYVVIKDHPEIRVLWGSEPGQETAEEQIAPEKMAELTAFYRANKTLQISSEPTEIDLRSRGGVKVIPLEKIE